MRAFPSFLVCCVTALPLFGSSLVGAQNLPGTEAIQMDARFYGGGKIPVPAGARATLRLPATVMIGEEIPAALVIENTGAVPFDITAGGDYRGTGYPQRIRVRARDETRGRDLASSPRDGELSIGGGFMHTHTLAPGQSHAIEFPLECYVGFPQAGAYRITVGHDLGWIVDPAHPHPFATGVITVTEPTPAQARALVEKILAPAPGPSPADASATFERQSLLEKQLSVLRHPAYLDALAPHARSGSTAAVKGVGHIASPEATALLLELLDNPSPPIALAAAQELRRRLPSRDNETATFFPYPFASLYQIEPLLPASWDAKFDSPLLAAAVRLLGHPDPEVVEAAAQLLQIRGEPVHAAAILAALDRSLAIYREPRVGTHLNTLDPPRPESALIATLATLRQRGWRVARPSSTAETLAWFDQLADPAIPPPPEDAWRDRVLSALESRPATLQIHALRAIPHPMPDAYAPAVLRALDDPDWGVIREACTVAGKSPRPLFARPLAQIIETVPDTFTQHAAHGAALACDPGPELWQAWTAVITNEDRLCDAVQTLVRGTLDLPFANGGWSGNSGLTRDQRFLLRDAWRKFLHDHQDMLAAGRRVPVTDPALVARLTGLDLRPGDPVVEITLQDGTRWPPR